MKQFFTSALFAALLAGIGFSCQNDEYQSVSSPDALTSNSQLSLRLAAVTSNDTQYDDMIDSTSCYSIQLPFDVTINGVSLHIAEPSDYAIAQEILDNGPTAAGEGIVFSFPITLIGQNYQLVPVYNQAAFDVTSDAVCDPPEEGSDCLSLVYPITVTAYSSATQTPLAQTFENDSQFLYFLLGLAAGDYYEINYPVTAENGNGESVTINSNGDFQDVIASATENCTCDNPNVLTDDLVLYIPFANELDDLTDFSTPTITGNYHYVTDRSGNPNAAFSFDDGTNNGENTIQTYQAAAGNLMQNGQFTIALWFNRQNPEENELEQLVNSIPVNLFLGNQEPGIMGPWIAAGGSGVYDETWAEEQLGAALNEWHHVVVTFDGQLISLYRDGQLRAFYEGGQDIPSVVVGLSFSNRYRGYMDDIRCYKRALNADEIGILYELPGDVSQCLD